MPQNSYACLLSQDLVRIQRRLNGADTTLCNWVETNVGPPYVWNQWRCTWWEYFTANLQRVLRIQVEKLVTGTWITKCSADDAGNYFADSEINRVGFFFSCSNIASATHVDDTEVWKPIE